MGNTALISIALCTYNGEEFIRAQMDSLLNQSYPFIEIVIIDDCSSDNTLSILDEYAKDNAHIKLYKNEANLGYNKNFEKTLKLCSGEFIAICDQDDIWRKDKLEILIESIEDNELIYHDSEFIDSRGNQINFKISDKFNFYKGNSPLPFLFLNCVSGHSILMRRSLLNLIFPFPENFHYDQWITYIAANQGSVTFTTQCLVQYRQHDKNSTDILAVRSKHQKATAVARIKKLEQESLWLKVCSEHTAPQNFDLVKRLYQLSLKRNVSFASFALGLKIWQHHELLLFLLKKGEVSKFFFTLRKIWGPGTKRVL